MDGGGGGGGGGILSSVRKPCQKRIFVVYEVGN